VVSVYTRGGSPVEAQFAALFAGIGRAVAATLA
jgi:beta-lactamase class A